MTNALTTRNEFIARHIGPRDADTQSMLDALGYEYAISKVAIR